MLTEKSSAEHRTEEIIALLRESGGRVTPQRIAIVRAALAIDHPSVDQVYQAVRHEFPMTSLATVYKTLSLLEEMGEALSVGFTDEVVHYDTRNPTPHAHAVCLRCGRIEDLPAAGLESAVEEVGQSLEGWRFTPRIEIWGLCRDCANQQASSR